MTTIACDRKEMFGDLQWTNGTTKWKGKGKVFKIEHHDIHPVKGGFIVGFAGTAGDIIAAVQYFSYPDLFKGPPKTGNNFNGLVLTYDGKVYDFTEINRWLELSGPYVAIGSGRELAMGAMLAGKSPKEAVEIATKHDIYTGMGVRGYSIV